MWPLLSLLKLSHCYCQCFADMDTCRNRRTNGATQTFRRPSLATNQSSTSQPRDSASLANRNSSENPGVYIPPHRNGNLAEHRYSKEQLLELFQNQRENNDLSEGLEGLYVAGWEPSAANGVTSGSWGRRDESSKDHALGVDVCWEREGTSLPLSLTEMTEEDREVRMQSTSVNFCDESLTHSSNTST